MSVQYRASIFDQRRCLIFAMIFNGYSRPCTIIMEEHGSTYRGDSKPPVVEQAVERELREKQNEYTAVEAALRERTTVYETAVADLDQVIRDLERELDRVSRVSADRVQLEERLDRMRRQRWEIVDTFLAEKHDLEQELVRLRGDITELEAVVE